MAQIKKKPGITFQHYYSPSSSPASQESFRGEVLKTDNALNQHNNVNYSYQISDMKAIGSGLMKDFKDVNFIGILEKEDIKTKLDQYKNPKTGEKIVGIYSADNNKFVTFCIENTKEGIKVYNVDPSYSANMKDFLGAIKEVFGVKRLPNKLGDYSDLIKDTDYGLLALANLRALSSNLEKPYNAGENEEEYQNNITRLREEFADIYAQQVFGRIKNDMNSLYTAWKQILRECGESLADILNRAQNTEELSSYLLDFFKIYIEIFQGTNIEIHGDKKITLLDIFVERNGEEMTLKPNALTLFEELTGEMQKQNKELSKHYSTSVNKTKQSSNISFFTDGQIIVEYYNRFGDIQPSKLSSSNSLYSSYEEYKADSKHNAFNEYFDQKYEYQTTDIEYISNQIMNDFKDNIEYIGTLGKGKNAGDISIEAFLRQYKNKMGDEIKKAGVGVYNTNGNHWIAFSIIPGENKTITVIYKDSLLRGKSSDFEDEIKKAFPETEGWALNIQQAQNDSAEQNETPLVSCGLFVLKNMEIMAKEISRNKDNFIASLNDIPFYNPIKPTSEETVNNKILDYATEIKNLREEFAIKYAKHLYEVIVPQGIELDMIRNQKQERHKDEAMVLTRLLEIQDKNVIVEISLVNEEATKYMYQINFPEDKEAEVINILKELFEFEIEPAIEKGKDKFFIKVDPSKIKQSEKTDVLVNTRNTNQNKIIDHIESDEKTRKREFIDALNITERLPTQTMSDRIKELTGIEIPSHESIQQIISNILQRDDYLDMLQSEQITLANLAEMIVDDISLREKKSFFGGFSYKAEKEGKLQAKQDEIFKKYIISIIEEIRKEFSIKSSLHDSIENIFPDIKDQKNIKDTLLNAINNIDLADVKKILDDSNIKPDDLTGLPDKIDQLIKKQKEEKVPVLIEIKNLIEKKIYNFNSSRV